MCVTPTLYAHYINKYEAEKVNWKYDQMDAGDKKIFNDYITKWISWHQKNDGRIKEKAGYSKMTVAERNIFDKLHVAYNINTDYFDINFDA